MSCLCFTLKQTSQEAVKPLHTTFIHYVISKAYVSAHPNANISGQFDLGLIYTESNPSQSVPQGLFGNPDDHSDQMSESLVPTGDTIATSTGTLFSPLKSAIRLLLLSRMEGSFTVRLSIGNNAHVYTKHRMLNFNGEIHSGASLRL